MTKPGQVKFTYQWGDLNIVKEKNKLITSLEDNFPTTTTLKQVSTLYITKYS